MSLIHMVSDDSHNPPRRKNTIKDEACFRAIYENSLDAILLTTTDGAILSANPAACKLFGRSEDEILSLGRACVVDASDPRLAQALEERARTGRFHGELMFLQRDGTKFPAEVSSVVYKDRDGLDKTSMIIRDVTERERADEMLRRNEEILREAQSLSHIGHWYWDLTTDKLSWSEEIFRIFGVDSQSFSVSAESFEKTIHPDDLSSFLQKRERMLTEESDAEIGHRIVRPDGEVRHVLERSKVMRDGSGNAVYVMGTVQDVTERIRAEEVLKENERAKSQLLDHLNEAQHIGKIGSWEWNLHTNHIWWSDETYRIFGVTPQDYVPSFEANGKFIHPDDFAKYRQSFEHCFQTGELLDLDVRLVANDGLLKHCQAKGMIIHDDSGQPVRFIGMIMDVTERIQIEEALRKSEERLDLAVQSARIGLWDQDFENDVINRNSIWAEMLGYDPKEIEMNRNAYLSLIHPDDFQKVKEKIEEHESGKSDIFYVENRMKTKNNDWKWVLNTGKIVQRSLDGKPLRAIGMHIDIHDQKQAIESLKKSEEMLSEAQSLAHIGHWIWDLTTGKLSWSDEIFRIFGFSPQSFLVSAKIFDKTIHPDDLDSFLLARELMLVEETDVEIGHRVVRPDGEVRHVLERAKATRDGSGKIVYVMGTIMDVTERMRVEEVLRESEAKYQSLFENSMIGIFQSSREGRLIRINSAYAKMFGYPNSEDMIRENLDIGTHLSTNPEQRKDVVRLLLEKGVMQQRELEMIRRDGSRFWMLLTAREERDSNGKFLYYEGTTIDITERTWAIEELGRNQSRLRELTSLLMHAHESERKKISMELHDEIGQALTAVKINLADIEKEIPLDTQSYVRERLAETDDLTEKMIEQIHQMALDLRPALLDDLGLIPTLRWYVKHFMTRTGLDVHLDTGRLAARMHADIETAIYRIVQEALTNITKHADATHVRIRMQRKCSVFTLSITDDGKGFDVKTLESNKKQAGLGLMGIRERSTSLNGSMDIESALGHGTTLRVSLPYKGLVNG